MYKKGSFIVAYLPPLYDFREVCRVLKVKSVPFESVKYLVEDEDGTTCWISEHEIAQLATKQEFCS